MTYIHRWIKNIPKKFLFLLLTFGFSLNSYGQEYPELEKALAKEYPEESTEPGRWVYYKEEANVVRLNKPLLQSRIPKYSYYKVTMTNILGHHVNQETCAVLFDSVESKITLVEPVWFGGTSHDLIKLFLGKKFKEKKELLNFMNELNDVMQVGSGYKYRQTSFSDSLATFDLAYQAGDTNTISGSGTSSTVVRNDEGIWRKIIIELKDNAIIRYIEINPATNEKEVIE